MIGSLDRVAWEPSETAWAKLLAQLVVFKEESQKILNLVCNGDGVARNRCSLSAIL